MAFPLFNLSCPPCLQPKPSPFLPLTSQPKPYLPILLSIARKHRPFFSIVALSSSSAAAPGVASEGTLETSLQPRKRLIAQNIPWTSTVEDIANLFQKYGTVVNVELSMYNRERNRGLAFITMASEEEAITALNSLNTYNLDGRVIKVEFSRSLKKIPTENTPVEKHTVFVGNLAWRVRSKDLRELFEPSYNVISAEVIFHSKPRRPAGYGFVAFASKEEAEAAVASFNAKKLMGRQINLVLRDSPEENQIEQQKLVEENNVSLELSN
ncbi:29 kDa ribonucleoprotein B, chloroplastic [Dioscorea cayenensis subsp. rotundata]|uniref:29 kDa ribonucleoprotein B, chloroplastic n=1 Tax=Dioscorea cayennensis subsp. rotundata TaxID=55577 RepID=A0AB40CYB0_DIOCR|nr:29 kDa ribonucleoprotein B, chloroplastic [Dioscorea cayenensis subsp. rotundata]